jgi:hypothetical protein
MANLRIEMRERDRMTAEIANRGEIDAARKKCRAEMTQAPEKLVGEFVPTPNTVEFAWSAARAYQREGGSPRDIVDIIMADKDLLHNVAPEFSADEIEVNVLPKE